MKQFILGLILLGLLCFGMGFFTGVIYENITLNERIVENLQQAATENSTIKLNEQYYIISHIGTFGYPITVYNGGQNLSGTKS